MTVVTPPVATPPVATSRSHPLPSGGHPREKPHRLANGGYDTSGNEPPRNHHHRKPSPVPTLS